MYKRIFKTLDIDQTVGVEVPQNLPWEKLASYACIHEKGQTNIR